MEGRHAGPDVRERERRETFLRSPRDSNSGAGLGVPNEQEQRRGGKTAVGGREDQSLLYCTAGAFEAAPFVLRLPNETRRIQH